MLFETELDIKRFLIIAYGISIPFYPMSLMFKPQGQEEVSYANDDSNA